MASKDEDGSGRSHRRSTRGGVGGAFSCGPARHSHRRNRRRVAPQCPRSARGEERKQMPDRAEIPRPPRRRGEKEIAAACSVRILPAVRTPTRSLGRALEGPLQINPAHHCGRFARRASWRRWRGDPRFRPWSRVPAARGDVLVHSATISARTASGRRTNGGYLDARFA